MSQFRIIKPIGVVRSPFKQKYGTPRQSGLTPSIFGEIQLDPELNPPGCLDGLEEFSHVWVIFQFHKNSNETLSGKVHPPRLKGKKVGLYASRSPHRPNPIGLSVLKIEKVNPEELSLTVSGLDIVDQTPVLDIKPYIFQYDGIPTSKNGWTDSVSENLIAIDWATDVEDSIRKQIEEFLQFDPRNLEDIQRMDESKIHKIYFNNFDIHFSVSKNNLTILQIQNT